MGSRITIRRARPEDTAAIGAINAAGQPGVAPLTPVEMAAIAAGTLRCWVADDSAAVLGYLIAYAAGDAYDGEEFAWFGRRYPALLYVDQIAVAPAGRRRGIGSALYAAARAAAVAEGHAAFTCEVNLDPPNPISPRFHDQLGFHEVGVLRTADGRTVVLLRLPSPAVGGASTST
ncbi:MAG TPA: GNAT family N-acetyltransferase [Ktedonobacterales bacterium]|jgi:hypothetical protein